MSLLTSDAEQAMRNRGTQWEAMEKATGMDRIFAFIKLYKEVANPTDTSSGVSSLQAMKLLKHAVSTSQEKLKHKSGAQLGEEVKERMEAASNAGAYVVIAQKEEAYMAKKKLTWDNPTSQEQAAGPGGRAGQVVELVGRGGLVEDAYSKGAAIVLESVEGALWGRVEAEVFVSCGDGNRVRAGMVGDVWAEPVKASEDDRVGVACGVEEGVNDGAGAGVDHAEAAVLKADPANLEGGAVPVHPVGGVELVVGEGQIVEDLRAEEEWELVDGALVEDSKACLDVRDVGGEGIRLRLDRGHALLE
ncbi:hypothetical protein THAOC_28687, partial [Thalassiosira oceanica]